MLEDEEIRTLTVDHNLGATRSGSPYAACSEDVTGTARKKRASGSAVWLGMRT
jgi:hypothetical protein